MCENSLIMKKLSFVFIVLFILIVNQLIAQAYKIEIKIDGVSDTTVMLGHHFGEKKYVIDTMMADKSGKVVFEGDEALKRGIYIIVLPSENNSYFEFLVDDDQTLSLETSTKNYVENMKVKGSKTNTVFNEYQKKMSVYQEKIMDYQNKIKLLPEDNDSIDIFKTELTNLSEERKDYMAQLVAENKDNLFGKIINAIIEPEIPEPPKDEEGNIMDSSFQYRYYREHYFDHIDFSESGLLRTPILKARVNNYFKQMLPPIADTVIPEANMLITKSKANDEMFRFMVSHMLNYFETSKIMGMDKAFAALAEQWYLSGEAYWADSTLLSKIAERVHKITPNLIGNVAPDIPKVPTWEGEFASLHAIDADYTILVFYEPNCGHCKKIVPKLHKIYKDTLKAENVEVFAVYTQIDREEWDEFITDKEIDLWINVYDPYGFSNFRNNYDIYSTPVIYILDKEKRIIAKRIDVDQITSFLEFDRKRRAKENE
jgi:thiol-disulfide isomerase/thioredoxin